MKIFSKFVQSLVVFAFLASTTNAYEINKDYFILEKPLDVGNNTLIKVFSYACIHCYQYDKTITSKVVSNLDGVDFKVYHLKTKGEYAEAVSKIFATLLVLDEAKGVGMFDDKSMFKKAKFAIYRSYHDKKEEFKNVDEFMNMALKAAGVSRDKFEKASKLPKVSQLLNTWNDAYGIASISGVPAFVVNGRYLVNLDSVSTIDGLTNLIKELLTK